MEEKIKNIMSAVFEIPIEEINNESSPDTIESWDSLKHINLIIAIEEEFNVYFSSEQIIEAGDGNFKLINNILKRLLDD